MRRQRPIVLRVSKAPKDRAAKPKCDAGTSGGMFASNLVRLSKLKSELQALTERGALEGRWR